MSTKINYWLLPGLKKWIPVRKISHYEALVRISAALEVSMKDIMSRSRKQEVVDARHIIMWILRKEYKMKVTYIAETMARMDHTTVTHGVNKVDSLMSYDVEFRNKVNLAKSKL